MNAPVFENLDLACAKVGKTIAEQPSKELEKKELKNLITRALAVLEEQGIYALFLYLKAQGKNIKNIGETVSDRLYDFLKETPRQSHLLENGPDVLSALQKLGENLDRLLLACELVQRSLVYARYHVRLREEERGVK